MATTIDYGVSRTGDRRLVREVEVGSANTLLTSTSQVQVGIHRRLLYAQVYYNGVTTQTGVIFTLDSGAGAAYDVVQSTGAANAQLTTFTPSLLYLIASATPDQLVITCPAGGPGVTANVIMVFEEIS